MIIEGYYIHQKLVGAGWAEPCLHPPSLAVYLFTLHRISRTFTIVNDCNHVQLGWMPLKMSTDT